jgi:Arc/MetJ family transcription regulator
MPPEDVATTTVDTGADEAAAAAAAEAAKTPVEKTFTQAAVDTLVTERLARQKAQFADYNDLKTKAAEFEKLTTETGKLSELVGTLTNESASLKSQALRLEVALEKGLHADLVDALKGTNKEELLAHADKLLKHVRPTTGSFSGAATIGSEPKANGMTETIRAAILGKGIGPQQTEL